jgi:integrase
MRSKFIEKATVARLRTAIGSRGWLPLRTSLETGLRIGDVVALRDSNLTLRNKKPAIIATASKTGKTGVFPISPALYDLLKNAAARSRSGYLFPSYGKTGHLTRQAAWARMKRAAQDLGIDPAGISPHSLRKNFAVALYHEHGLSAVKNALQHSNDAVSRVYAYADTILNFDSDAPIRWRDVELIVDYILERISGRG